MLLSQSHRMPRKVLCLSINWRLLLLLCSLSRETMQLIFEPESAFTEQHTTENHYACCTKNTNLIQSPSICYCSFYLVNSSSIYAMQLSIVEFMDGHTNTTFDPNHNNTTNDDTKCMRSITILMFTTNFHFANR